MFNNELRTRESLGFGVHVHPVFSILVVRIYIVLVDLRNLGDKRIIGLGVREQEANG